MKLFIKKIKIIYNVKRVFKIENFDIYIAGQDFDYKIKQLKYNDLKNNNKNYDSNNSNESESELDDEDEAISGNFNFSFVSRNRNQTNLKYLKYIINLQNWYRRITSKNKIKKLKQEQEYKNIELVSIFYDSILPKDEEKHEEICLHKITSKQNIKNKSLLKESRNLNDNSLFFNLFKLHLVEIPHKKEKDSIKLDPEDIKELNIIEEESYLTIGNIRSDEPKITIIDKNQYNVGKESENDFNSTNEKWNKLLNNELYKEKKENNQDNIEKELEITNKSQLSKNKENDLKEKQKDSKVNMIKTKPKNYPIKNEVVAPKNFKSNNEVKDSNIKVKAKDLDIKKIIKIQRLVRRFIERKKSNIERKNCCNCLIF